MSKKYWFRRKKYGWGWVPSSWEGWLVTMIFLIVFLLVVLTFNADTSVLDALSLLVVPVLLLTAVCFMTGESPKWQWGGDDKEDNE